MIGRLAALGMALSAAPATAGGVQSFCDELDRVVRAGTEKPSFASLEHARDITWLTFDSPCHVLDDALGRRFICSQSMAPVALNQAALDRATAQCLPAAERRVDGELGDVLFRLGAVRIRIIERGTPEGHIGRQVYYVVTRD
jgi:hypothetical protein